jgi:hypothetical protein
VEYALQNSTFCSVKTVNGGELLAETTLVGTNVEAFGWLVIDRSTFIIKNAGWEVTRSPAESLNGSGILHGLKGVTAYFHSGGDLRREAGDIAGGLVREMLVECVRGIIQAETFLYVDRGYPNPEAYGEYWEKFYLNSCRYYSNLHRVSRRWSDYVGGYYTDKKLFARAKNCSIKKFPGGFTAVGTFGDSFHEMVICLNIDDDGMVLECQGNFLRAPDPVCFENASLLEKLKGTSLLSLNKKQIVTGIGGPGGCDHLVDLVYTVAKGFREALQH